MTFKRIGFRNYVNQEVETVELHVQLYQGRRKRCGWCRHGRTTFSANVPILYHKPIVHDMAGLLCTGERTTLAPRACTVRVRGLTR